MMTRLFDMYILMSAEDYDACEASNACREFALQYGALRDEAEAIHGPGCPWWKDKAKITSCARAV